MLKKNLKFYLSAIVITLFAVGGVVLADTIVNNYYGNVTLTQNANDQALGAVSSVGGVCDGSEPATQLCNVNVYELESQTAITASGDGSFDDTSATTTMAVGGTNAGHLCLWNGTNYSIISFAADSSTVVTATSTTCN